MPNLIIQHFEPLCAFLLPLLLHMSQPQQRHALNVVGALLVCGSKHKTLTTLTAMLRLPHADHFALADFFRQSGWCPLEVRRAVLTAQLATVARLLQTDQAVHCPVFLSVDDSLAVKDVGTRALQAVTFHHDHVKQRRQSGKYTNAARYVMINAHICGFSFPLTWRLYLSRRQVRRLNRARVGAAVSAAMPAAMPKDRLVYRKLIALVIEMLDEIAPKIPAGRRVYVLFDSWYASAELLNNIRARGWHFICAVKSNRNLSGLALGSWWPKLSRQRIQRVKTHNSKGSHTYYTRYTTGRLRSVPQQVGAVLSKRSPRRGPIAFFVTSDLHLRAQGILRYYAIRWQAETDNFLLKQRLGLADFRLHTIEATLRWFSLVFAAYAFVRVRIAQVWLKQPSQPKQSFGDVIAEQQRWHLQRLITFVADQARQGWSNQQLLDHLLPT